MAIWALLVALVTSMLVAAGVGAVELDGVEAIIFTDIGRDGMLTGVNLESTVALARSIVVPVIASGGITNLDDIRVLCAVADEGIVGAITGRAIYEGSLVDIADRPRMLEKAFISFRN